MSNKSDHSLLLTKRLTKAFDGITAVKEFDFCIKEGEIVALIGPNGSGKTVLFNLITRLYPPDSGEIQYGQPQRNLLKYRSDQIAQFGICRTFQTLRLFLHLSVLENVLVGMHVTLKSSFLTSLLRTSIMKYEERQAEEKAFELLSFFGERLLSMANQPALVLSHANRRRLEIVRAMASSPALLLLDEPSAGMNPSETIEIMNDIKKIHQRGITILLIEHKMSLVEGIADRVVVLNHGVKIAEGGFEQIKSDQKVIEAYLGRRKEIA